MRSAALARFFLAHALRTGLAISGVCVAWELRRLRPTRRTVSFFCWHESHGRGPSVMASVMASRDGNCDLSMFCREDLVSCYHTTSWMVLGRFPAWDWPGHAFRSPTRCSRAAVPNNAVQVFSVGPWPFWRINSFTDPERASGGGVT